MSLHKKHPRVRARNLAMRRVRAITTATGLGSAVAAAVLAVATAGTDAAASGNGSAQSPGHGGGAGAHPPVRPHDRHRAPASLHTAKRLHRTRTIRHATPAPAPSPTQSATTSGGSHSG